MSLPQAVVLGIVQGLTEYLPVSSTAHLRIVPAIAHWDDPGAAFTAVIQLGTLLAVLLYFRADIGRILAAMWRGLRDPAVRKGVDARTGWYVVLGTIPISVFGLAFKDQIKSGARDLYVIGVALIVLGVVLGVAEKVGSQRRPLEKLDARDGAGIGLAQTLALIPGVSRSGSTITAGLFLGLTREAAARYSFLLSIPAVVLSGLFELKDIGKAAGPGEMAASGTATVVATVLAFVVGYASIAFFLKFLTRHGTGPFVAYRIAIGITVIALHGAGTIS